MVFASYIRMRLIISEGSHLSTIDCDKIVIHYESVPEDIIWLNEK